MRRLRCVIAWSAPLLRDIDRELLIASWRAVLISPKGKLHTVRLKNQRTINDRVSHDISAKCGGCRSEKQFKISRLLNPY